MMTSVKKLLPWSLALLVGIGLGALWQQTAPLDATASSVDGKLHFVLNGADGPVRLSDSDGQLRIVYLGYLSCPDVCPTALSRLGGAMNQLSPQQLARLQPYFISVDVERDTPENLALYSAYFHPGIIGATGDRAAVDAVVSHLQAYYRIVPLADSALGYSVDHSANLYLLDGDGRLLETFPDTPSPSELAGRLKSYL